ncbi:phytanoyl-CoA dioxygenase-like protein [Polyplosphaeria fusca]|uniref:Phytanoyl-CoA dioxygenase-like protein n=1 Tax=Polyplosphaeria fusca TaxID=682080 RepID=A0A9P4QN12_9PLEO|nr:phytanoyl-CoA dioxygenase-like protein [Polyplosphaeria fusca]
MVEKTTSPVIPPRLFSPSNATSLEAFKTLVTTSTCPDYPLATEITQNIPIYTLPPYSTLTPASASALQDEWSHILLSGPGIFITRSLFPSRALLTTVNSVYDSILAAERSSRTANGGDHFAPSGANSRLWNSLSKHCLADPVSFLEYYSNPYLALISSAWLGPAHRITAQLNTVHPGGAPQTPHRDYHLGFQSAESCALFPRHQHTASQFLTLQGAVAHSDMPAASGPTRLLPFSQRFEGGYLAYRRPEFAEFFDKSWVSVPLGMGDGMFFNPALFHAAGANTSAHVHRSANLLQISSAFGKPMENIDTEVLIERCWEGLVGMYTEDGEVSARVRAAVGCLGEGYAFPTNLDRRVPESAGMAPESEQELLVRALKGNLGKEEVMRGLRRMKGDSLA